MFTSNLLVLIRNLYFEGLLFRHKALVFGVIFMLKLPCVVHAPVSNDEHFYRISFYTDQSVIQVTRSLRNLKCLSDFSGTKSVLYNFKNKFSICRFCSQSITRKATRFARFSGTAPSLNVVFYRCPSKNLGTGHGHWLQGQYSGTVPC